MRPMSHSQKPPNQEACFGMNFHSMPLCERVSAKSVDKNRALSYSAAAKYVKALLDNRSLGTDLRPVNIRSA